MAEPTPIAWTQRLDKQLDTQRKHARLFDGYYTGARRLALVDKEYRDVFGSTPTEAALAQLTPPSANVASVGVDALAERLQIEGFTPAGTTGGLEESSVADAAAAVWDGSDMDVMHSVSILESLIKSRSFLQRAEGPDGGTLSVEDPEQVAVLRQMQPPYGIDAAIKRTPDAWGGPEIVTLWANARRFIGSQGPRGLTFDEGTPVGAVPLYEVAYRQRLIVEPVSYIASVGSLADSYTLLTAYLVIAARFGAVPIITMSGVRLPRDPATGLALPFGTDPKRPEIGPKPIGATEALASEDPGARFGRISGDSLAGYVAAMQMLQASIMAMHRTPGSYYGLGATSGTSGETVKASEAGLERRKADAQRYLALPFRRAISDTVSADLGRSVRLAVRWANTETHIEAQDADAAGKYVAAGLDLRTTLEHIGFPAATIEAALARAEAAKAEGQAILDALNAQTGAGGATMAIAGTGVAVDTGASDADPVKIKAAADALGALIRAGVEAADAAQRVGLPGLKFTGAVPVSLRLPDAAAASLEGGATPTGG